MKLRMQIIYIKWYVEKFLKICKWRIYLNCTQNTNSYSYYSFYFSCVQMQRGESDASPRDQRQERGLELARPRHPRTHGEWLPHPRRLQRWPSIRNTLWISPWGCFQPVTSKFHNICTSIKIYFLGVKNSCSFEIRLIHQKTAMKRIIMNMYRWRLNTATDSLLWKLSDIYISHVSFSQGKTVLASWLPSRPHSATQWGNNMYSCFVCVSPHRTAALQHCSRVWTALHSLSAPLHCTAT